MRPDSYKEFSPNIIWEKIIRIIYTQYGIIHVSRLIFAGSFASKRWPGIFLSPFLLQVPLAVLKRFSILTIPDNLQVTVSAQSINFHVTILHSKPYHVVEVAFYDQGKHQSKQGTKVITQKFTHPAQKKFKGDLPTLAQLQNL